MSVIKITQSGTDRIATLDWEDSATFSGIESSYSDKKSAPAAHLKDLPRPLENHDLPGATMMSEVQRELPQVVRHAFEESSNSED